MQKERTGEDSVIERPCWAQLSSEVEDRTGLGRLVGPRHGSVVESSTLAAGCVQRPLANGVRRAEGSITMNAAPMKCRRLTGNPTRQSGMLILLASMAGA